MIVAFEPTIREWQSILESATTDQLKFRPAPGEWTLGQLFVHILEESNHFLSEAQKCMQHDINREQKMTAEAEAMFAQNEFPDIRIKGDPAHVEKVLQIDNIQHLAFLIGDLKNKVSEMEKAILNQKHFGKTQHPGLGFFDALEWHQYTEMHMRHHLRQKDRILKSWQDHHLIP
ncbi:MAG: DinB family protein [Saprospiraceae bacterium]|nr:DinB family protein [Saprospiraceae bacterium]